MAKYILTISGEGPAFNSSRPHDIDTLAGQFITTLSHLGHKDVAGTVRASGASEAVIPAKSHLETGLEPLPFAAPPGPVPAAAPVELAPLPLMPEDAFEIPVVEKTTTFEDATS